MEPAEDMHLDECGEQHSWKAEALAVAEDIEAALQGSNSEIDDVSGLGDLCLRASQAWTAAAACHPSSIPPQALRNLAKLSNSTIKLAHVLFCQPKVAATMLEAGSYASATDHLKAAIRMLSKHFDKFLETVSKALAEAADDQQHAATAFLRELLPAVQVCCQQLLPVVLTVTSYTARTASPTVSTSPQVPTQMRSMSVLSLAWTTLTKLLVGVPADARQQVLQPTAAVQGLQVALQQLLHAIRDLCKSWTQQPPDKRETLARFWMQNTLRLAAGVAGAEAVDAALGPLLEAMLEVYQHVTFPEGDWLDDGLQAFLSGTLQVKLLGCLASLLASSPDNTAATQAKIDHMLDFCNNSNTAANAAAAAAGMPLDGSNQASDQHARLQLFLLVILDLMQQLPSSDAPLEVIEQASRRLLAWAVQTTGGSLCPLVLGQEMGGALLQHCLQACLAFVVGCMSCLAQQQQQELLASLVQLCLSQHPVVSFLAQQLLADVLACADQSTVELQLSGLLQLLEATAVCAAVPGADLAMLSRSTGALVDTMVAILQACDRGISSSWVGQYLRHGSSGSASSSDDGSSSNWMDAGSCSLLACQARMLLCLGPLARPVLWVQENGQEQPSPFVEENLSQLWLTAQQVLELLGPQQQQRQRPHNTPADSAAAEQLLAMHQLSWQLQAMAALLQLQAAQAESAATADGNAVASGSTQSCTAFALDVLKAIHSSGTSNGCRNSSSAAYIAAQGACTGAALQVLAAAGYVAVQEGAAELLQLLHDIGAKQESVHALLAAVVGNIGVPPGKAQHEELFHMLLSSPHWSVRHAAFDGLLARLRHNSYSGSGIVRLLPRCMRASTTEATPAVIQIVKAHLHRNPDTQAQQAYECSYHQLVEQHNQVLAAAVNNAGNGCNDCSMAVELSQLEALLSACSAGMPADGSALGSAAVDVSASRSLQALLQLATRASSSLDAIDKALSQAESDVRLLMSAATAAAQGHELDADQVTLVSRQGTRLVGSCASMCSRLRALQDSLACLKG